MPRAVNGTYTLPAGNPVVTLTAISSATQNSTMSDVATALTDSLSRSGLGPMTASLQLASGLIGVPGLSWSAETTSGLYRSAVGDFRYSIAATDRIQITANGLRVTDGAIGTPALSFISDTNTGIFRAANDVMAFISGGVEIFRANVGLQLSILDGTVGTPGLGYINDTDTGFYRIGTNDFLATAGNLNVAEFLNNAGTAQLNVGDGLVGKPGLSFIADADSGLYRIGANRIGVTLGGALIVDMAATAFQLSVACYVPDGAVGTPSYSFGADANTGFYRSTTDDFVAVAGGVLVADFFLNGATTQMGLGDGAVGKPSHTFVLDTDTGLYRIGANSLGIAVAGGLDAQFDAQGFGVQATGSAAAPQIYVIGDTDTGVFRVAGDTVGLSAGGLSGIQITGLGGGNVNVALGASAASTLSINSTSAATANIGAAGAPPAQVVGYLAVTINGTARKIPYYAN